jgi:V8-like Glu-specific endopeptidase
MRERERGDEDVLTSRMWPAILGVCAVIGILTLRSSAVAQNDWVPVVEGYLDSTVWLRVQGQAADDATYGSGFFVTSDGLILTARHVLPRGAQAESGRYTILGLVGIRGPGVPVGEARLVELVFLPKQSSRDVAILRFKVPIPGNILPAPVDRDGKRDQLRLGRPIVIFGYPRGQHFSSYPGNVESVGEAELLATSALVYEGVSGGPVFGKDGTVAAMVIAGEPVVKDRGLPDVIKQGYVLPIDLVLGGLSDDLRAKILTQPKPTVLPTVEPGSIDVRYRISTTKDDHPVVFAPHPRDYRAAFQARPGFRIKAARVEPLSANHASTAVAEITDDGKVVVVRYSLTSGPSVDRWRGWLEAIVVTTQASLK